MSNKKNRLTEFEIVGLYHEYNVKLNLANEANVFIGENGIGKTTILNIMYYFFIQNSSELSKISFHKLSMKFEDTDEIHTFEKEFIIDYFESISNDKEEVYQSRRNKDKNIKTIFEKYFESIETGDMVKTVDSEGLFLYKKDETPNSLYFSIEKYLDDINCEHVNEQSEIEKVFEKINSYKILYLPTYRRIESELKDIGVSNESVFREINKLDNNLLIQFGMEDVEKEISNILEDIRKKAIDGFSNMTSILLQQYTNTGELEKKVTRNLDKNTVKIILERLVNRVDKKNVKEILQLFDNNEIEKSEYFYLRNYLLKLTENYELQREYDNKVIKFTETCNSYLENKKFIYNQSRLELNIYLSSKEDNESNNKRINLTELSSGEKQIISLFSKLYLDTELSKDLFLIIDEPELSLSIEWQKRLLPDILESKKCSNIVAVTHSPFIFENDLLDFTFTMDKENYEDSENE